MIRAVLIDIGDTLVEQKVDDVVPMSQLGLNAFADAAPTLATLKQAGYLVAAVSNTTLSDEREVRKALSELHLASYVDVIVTSVDVGHEKPHPAMYEKALERLGCRPSEAVMVGDDLLKDVGGAANVGIRTILLRRDPSRQLAADPVPTHLVSSLLEVPGLVSP